MKYKCLILSTMTLLSTMLCFARPPKVIKMMPENGAVDVKPGLTKIRILFDQDMARGFSVCGGGENYPEIIGNPKWTSSRACVITARLKPNHDYSFGINCSSAQNFKSTRGEPAEILFVKFRTAGLDGKAPSNSSPELKIQNKQAIVALQEALANHYSYKDMKDINWTTLFTKYKKSLIDADSPMDFAKTAGLMLAHAKDKHIWLKANGKHVSTYRDSVTPNVNLQVIPNIVPNFKKHNDLIGTGRFPGSIGYICINSWSRQKEKDFEQLYIALNELSDTSGLIIDVRANNGGAEPLAQKFAGCFIETPKLYAKHVYRDSNSPNRFSKVHERILQPNKDRPRYKGKVVVLSGPVVMSSCEAFVLMMKQVPNCKIIGGSTRGSSGNPKPHDLGNGVTVYLPSWKAMEADGTCFEGKGIKPDIPVKANSKQITNKDPVIEAALKVLSSNR